MSDSGAQPTYSAYAKQRLFRILMDYVSETKGMSIAGLANAITMHRNGLHFDRQNIYRLGKGTLQDGVIDTIIDWSEATLDPEIKSRLVPQAIFNEVGKSSRDYYFHMPAENDLDDWDKQLLQNFAGVYLCAPANDRNSFLPLTTLRRWFENRDAMPELERKSRSLDIKQYIQERTILVLQRTPGSYFYAAEFPMSLLFPNAFETLDIKMVYEGVGVISSNAIQIQLRECLSRVPKTHAILISEKNQNQKLAPSGISIHLPMGMETARKEWAGLPAQDIAQMRSEYALSIEADYYLTGSAQITASPLAFNKSKVTMSFPREMVYHSKPANFMRDKELHFIRPDLENTAEVEKILANPLSIGELL